MSVANQRGPIDVRASSVGGSAPRSISFVYVLSAVASSYAREVTKMIAAFVNAHRSIDVKSEVC
jgi:hypothetical protein